MIFGLETFMNQPHIWRDWMTSVVTDDMAETFFKATIAKSFTNQVQNQKTNEKQLEKLLGIWCNESDQLGDNKWALYNAMTYWSSHTKELKNPEVTRRNREDAISKAMQHKLWEDIV
jgi:ribosomal protein L3